MYRLFRSSSIAALLALACVTAAASAQIADPAAGIGQGRMEQAPEALKQRTEGVGISEHPGATLPMDLTVTGEDGKQRPLGSYFDKGKPVILQLGYFGCPKLCGLVSDNLIQSLKRLDLNMASDYEVVYVSIDPQETWRLAEKKKQTYVTEFGRPGAIEGWHFVTTTAANSKAIADAVGFQYKYIEADNIYSHPAMITILTPDGRVSRYLYGVDYPRTTLRLALVEASEGKIGTIRDQLIMLCMHWDGSAGQYTFAAMRLMRLGGGLTVLVVGFFLLKRYLRDWRKHEPSPLPA